MLTGELPWDKPTADQREYTNWKDLKYSLDPWRKIDNLPLSLLRKVLMPLPSKRYNLSQIQNHIWVKKKFKEGEGSSLLRSTSGGGAAKRICSIGEEQPSFSQPLPRQDSGSGPVEEEREELFHGFTQPAQLDDLVVSTQGATQSSQTQLQRLVKRMTRFWVTTDKEATEKELKTCLEREGCTTKVGWTVGPIGYVAMSAEMWNH